MNKIRKDQEIREPKLDRHTQQNFNAVADAMIQENNASILPQILVTNDIGDSLSLEKTIAQKEEKKSSWVPNRTKIICLFARR